MTDMSSSQILAIKSPKKLFSSDFDEAKRQYRVLASKWHPDKGGDTLVFQHINSLFERVEDLARNHLWGKDDVFRFRINDGRTYEMKYRTRKKFELGEMYVSDTAIAYVVDKDNSDLADNGCRTLKGIRFADEVMRNKFMHLMPSTIVNSKTDDGKDFIVYPKTPDLILLRDVLDHMKGRKIDPKHVAWMVSRMLNLAAFLNYNGICHGGISPDTLFVSPKHHSICILGGWWYSTKFGSSIVALPQRTLGLVPGDLIKAKKGDSRIDGHCVKSTGLELLGSVTGSKLIADKSIPRPMLDWLRSPPNRNPVVTYGEWVHVLEGSFGPRKFVEFNVTADDVYPPNR